ncbi:MAG: hypothetical protein AAF842_10660 [Planctomycetota bacterium]
MSRQIKSFPYAKRRVRELQRIVDQQAALLGERRDELASLRLERLTLARLAADRPQFDNPLHVADAKRLRDRVLEEAARR